MNATLKIFFWDISSESIVRSAYLGMRLSACHIPVKDFGSSMNSFFTISASSSAVLLSILLSANNSYASPQVMTFSKQLTLNTSQNQISGLRQGGEFSVIGNGLATVTLPSLNATGGFTGSNGASAFTTNLNSSFSYSSTARGADNSAGAATIALSGNILSLQDFSKQTGRRSGREFSAATDGRGSIAITNGSASPAVNVSNHSGESATASRSSSLRTSTSETSYSRTAYSKNEQQGFQSEAQASLFEVSGSGISAITNGGFTGGLTTDGDSVPITALAGGGCGVGSSCANGDSFNTSHLIRNGQNSAVLSASPTDVTAPGYGIVTRYSGGTTAGGITVNSTSRNLQVVGGGAGTKSSLSYESSLSVFN